MSFTRRRVYNFLFDPKTTSSPTSSKIRAIEKLPFPAIFLWRGGGKKREKKREKREKEREKKRKKEEKEREKKKEKRKRRERKNRRKTSRSYSESLVKTFRDSIRRRNGAPKDKFQLTNTH